ncbi:MAG TPA: hypothetical protein VLB11_05560 [Methyloceanibacter sp.]|nr:hypothetical protein [Methyloceanibacter sp.]
MRWSLLAPGRAGIDSAEKIFIRIVALDGDTGHLRRLAAALRAKYPDLTVSLVDNRLPSGRLSL